MIEIFFSMIFKNLNLIFLVEIKNVIDNLLEILIGDHSIFLFEKIIKIFKNKYLFLNRI